MQRSSAHCPQRNCKHHFSAYLVPPNLLHAIQAHSRLRAGSFQRPAPAAAQGLVQVHGDGVTLESSIDDVPASLVSEDPVHAAAYKLHIHQTYRIQSRHHWQRRAVNKSWLQLPSSVATRACPFLAGATLLPAMALLVAPQAVLQLLAAGASSPSVTMEALSSCFAQICGLILLFQAMVTIIVQGCAHRDQLGSTTCHRMLMATLLPFSGNLLALNKAHCSMAGIGGVASLQVASFTVHVLLHLRHHPWFFVKVFWPLAITMLITEFMPTNLVFMDGAAGPLGGIAAALLSVKVFGRLSRLAAKSAPKLASRWLGTVVTWLAKHALPRLTARLSKNLPRLARYLARFIPKLTRFGSRLAGRMAPRFAQDQLAGHTQQLAFPSADGLLTDTVARCIDLLPPKNAASWVYVGLMLCQLLMIVNAYSPGLLFNSAALATAGTSMEAVAGEGIASAAAAGDGASAAWVALVRFIKYTWGSGFFAAAFAVNCLKTAADREGHLWKPANRQLNVAMAVLQAGTAAVLLIGMVTGAVIQSPYAWFLIAAATLGACFCCTQAAAPGAEYQHLLQLATTASTPTGSATASAFGSMPQSEQRDGQHWQQYWQEQQQQQQQQQSEQKECVCTSDMEAFSSPDDQQRVPVSSIEWETVERADPTYSNIMSTTVLLLTLLQLTL